ncbi:MAG: hypothetical protein MRY32_01280 [Rickettsiales bacterium]|nr:hypothetical protein [Rickettsiales bacterium]
MRRLTTVIVTGLLLSACATANTQKPTTDWTSFYGNGQVAKVSNIKSLISPGFY